jgi:phosphate acyltransferase
MIAVDVMGGDHAPYVVLEGALAAAKKTIPVVLYGPQELIISWLDEHACGWEIYPITIVDAPDIIAMDDEPVRAVCKKPSSSLVKAAVGVAEGRCSAVLSAGNSGALMAAATLCIGKSDGVERPAIAGLLPVISGEVLALDLGANIECRPHHLLQFAHMGNAYAQSTLLVQHPRIGLLANGHEEGKGSPLIKEAHISLKKETLNFVGNVEPYDIFAGKVDVVVCDGFSGNVLLKTMEAVAELIASKIDLTQAQALKSHFSYQRCGGALLLGIKRPVIVCHGCSDAKAIENAITTAWNVSA